MKGKLAMKRMTFLITLLAICVAVYFLISEDDTDLILLDAQAIPVAGQKGMFMVTLEVENSGDAKQLIDVSSTSASNVHIMNPGYPNATLVIPSQSSGIFAMDGAHIMLMNPSVDFIEGSFIPLTLEFDGYGEVTTRLLNAGTSTGMAGMNHDMSNGVQADSSPQIQLSAPDGFNTTGFEIMVNVENFIFTQVEDSAAHIANEGHAHIYLNGLKMGRLFKPSFSLGPILKGSYDLTVSLNSNDHRPYINNGSVVASTLSFTVE